MVYFPPPPPDSPFWDALEKYGYEGLIKMQRERQKRLREERKKNG